MRIIPFILLAFLLLGCQEVPQEEHETQGTDIAATVNGQTIMQDEVEAFQEQIRLQTGQPVNETVALDNLIANRLLMQEAARQNLTMSTEEIEAMLTAELQSRGSTLQAFKDELTQEEYGSMVEQTRQQLALQDLGLSLVNVSNETVQTFYEENQEQLGNATVQDVRQYLEEQAAQQALQQYARLLMEQAEIER